MYLPVGNLRIVSYQIKKTLKIFNKNISWWGKVKCFKIFILAVMDINILCKFKILEIIYVSMLRINIKIIEIV